MNVSLVPIPKNVTAVHWMCQQILHNVCPKWGIQSLCYLCSLKILNLSPRVRVSVWFLAWVLLPFLVLNIKIRRSPACLIKRLTPTVFPKRLQRQELLKRGVRNCFNNHWNTIGKKQLIQEDIVYYFHFLEFIVLVLYYIITTF